MDGRTTIFARSSGSGRAGVAVYRISGPMAGRILDEGCGGRGQPRFAKLAAVRTVDGELIDHGLCLWFPGPASFTGEDVAEIHLHGSVAVDEAFGRAMIAYGLQPASAGAFTLRAFEAGKLDLTQAEGLADLLNADTEGQRRQALGQLGGRLSEVAEDWRAGLLRALGLLEASIDFADEEGVPPDVLADVEHTVAYVAAGMKKALDHAHQGMTTRDGITIVITGPPNAGKSSLLNYLAGSERAIVSAEAGTTRDVVSVTTEIAGQRVTLLDTAGLREASNEVEREGIRRALAAAEEADITIEVVDARQVPDRPPKATIGVANKTDLIGDFPRDWVPISLLTGKGLGRLARELEELVRTGDGGLLTRERHVALTAAAWRTLSSLPVRNEPELIVEEVRHAMRSLAELTGAIGTEDVLGEVFASFCIGK